MKLTIGEYIAQTGRSMASTARRIGVSRQTLYSWQEQGAVIVGTDKLGNVTKIIMDKVLYEEQVRK